MTVRVAPASSGGVFLLHSVDSPTAWTRQLAQGITEVLGDSVDVDESYLGLPSRGDEYFENKYEALLARFHNAPPAVVVTDGAAAFAFARKYRDDLFPEAGILYVNIPRPDPAYLSQCGDLCAGIPMQFDVQETVDLVFSLFPSTSVLIGIMDGSRESRILRQMVETAMEPYLDRAQVMFPGYELGGEEGLDSEKLRTVALSVPQGAAVLFIRYDQDDHGKPVSPDAMVQAVIERSVAPVFGLTDQWMGDGMVGGVMVSAAAQGREVGTMGRKMLAGILPADMLVEPLVGQVSLDVAVLERYGVAHANIPADAVLWHEPIKPTVLDTIEPVGWLGYALGCVLIAVAVFFWRSRR